MRSFKLTIEYDGTHFNGWQIQESGRRTVQGELETVLQKVFKASIRAHASGRTDSGTHASGQTAHFQAVTTMTPEQVRAALNANLPPDITILGAERKTGTFHARFKVRRKTYVYTLLNRPVRTSLGRDFCWHIPHKLNMSVMRAEVADLSGRHDFKGFMASDPCRTFREEQGGTKRRIYQAVLRKSGEYIRLEITADGFLYKMVRNIVGTLVGVGLGRLPRGTIRAVLRGAERPSNCTAPARGLCLQRVEY